MRIRRILCPTDFARTAKTALELASSIARDTGAELMLLHAEEPIHTEQEFSAEELTGLEQVLRKLAPRDRLASCSYHVVVGHPALEIVRFAAENDIDLIVVGTHGYQGMASVALGSVAREVVRDAPCVVLAIKPMEVHVEPSRSETDNARPALSEQELSGVLARLVTVCTDSARACRGAAADAKHEGLNMLLDERANQREGFAEELQIHAVSHGRVPKRVGSVSGVIQRNWMHFKALMGSHHAIIRSCIQEEERTEEAYENVLRLGIPNDVRTVLQRHIREVRLTARSLEGLEAL